MPVATIASIAAITASAATTVKALTTKAPKAPALPKPPEAPKPVEQTDTEVRDKQSNAAKQQRDRARSARGRSDTILTSGLGAAPGATQRSTLLGG